MWYGIVCVAILVIGITGGLVIGIVFGRRMFEHGYCMPFYRQVSPDAPFACVTVQRGLHVRRVDGDMPRAPLPSGDVLYPGGDTDLQNISPYRYLLLKPGTHTISITVHLNRPPVGIVSQKQLHDVTFSVADGECYIIEASTPGSVFEPGQSPESVLFNACGPSLYGSGTDKYLSFSLCARLLKGDEREQYLSEVRKETQRIRRIRKKFLLPQGILEEKE